MFNLTGKVALVTGASRGIGKGIAISLAQAGADVAVNYTSNPNKAEETVAAVKELGRNAFSIQADVSNKTQVESMVQQVVEKLGKIDILVNNAGILSYEPFLQLKEETWDRMIAVNLKGQFLVAQTAANQMVKQGTGGRIINISSIASGQVGVGYPMISHYCASKGGVVALSEAMALELVQNKINVNVIAPGGIESDMTASVASNPELLKRIPMGKIGKPEDIGAMAVFLASEEANYCTGAVFYVDGGYLAT